MDRVKRVGAVVVAAVALFALGGIGLFRSIGDRSPVPVASSHDATDALVAPVVPGGMPYRIQWVNPRGSGASGS